MNRFNQAIQRRVESELRQGRNVIVVGDVRPFHLDPFPIFSNHSPHRIQVNACHQEIDHCDPAQSIRDNGLNAFTDHPARQWLHQFLYPQGPMVDVYRHLHPNEAKAFTCWNTLINARLVISSLVDVL